MRILNGFLVSFFCLVSLLCNAQFNNSFVDPALAYNKVNGEKMDGVGYVNVGSFKVKGSPYIYGETLKGDVYHSGKIASGVVFKINNYSKELQVTTDVPGKYFMVSIDDLDSLVLPAVKNEFLAADIKFISSKAKDAKLKCFLEPLQKGERYTLYKSYSTELAIPSDNYVQSDLRIFDLQVQYYYADNQNPGSLKSVKANKKGLGKTFKGTNASEILENIDMSGNQDLALTKFFTFLK